MRQPRHATLRQEERRKQHHNCLEAAHLIDTRLASLENEFERLEGMGVSQSTCQEMRQRREVRSCAKKALALGGLSPVQR